jgi:hypothetical protein
MFILQVAAVAAEDEVYTLYRSAVPLPGAELPLLRIHIATFDAEGNGPGYNFENCNIAADLFSQQPGVVVRYWCERGLYRP